LIVPEVGISLESQKEAYQMYNKYASKVGFNIRKSFKKAAKRWHYLKNIYTEDV
jgi:hypothetical protein